jgi:O-antigen/teichoic acid export membrane protein
MGIVIKQSFKNIITTYIGFAFGAINTLFLYVYFLEGTYYGLIVFLLSTANILSPLLSFGAQHALLKFYSFYEDKTARNKLITTLLLLPIISIILVSGLLYFFKAPIVSWLTLKNTLIENYIWSLLLIAVFMAYFEVFYALARVQYQTVIGNAIKEIFLRVVVMVLLFLVYFKVLTAAGFIYALTGAYFLRALLMFVYTMRISDFKINVALPPHFAKIIKYALFIVLTFSVTALFFDIDKFMIPIYKALKSNAFYSVAIFIAMVIEVPARAMRQILWPMTAKALNDNNIQELTYLYKESAINLLLVGGLLYLLILLNIQDLYLMLPPKYSGGLWVVFMISFSKLYEVSLGNNDAILYNSNAYTSLVVFGVFLVISMIMLNNYFIPKYGIEGAALATLITMFLYSTIKLIFVKIKFGIQPFTWHTFYVFVVIKTLLLAFLFIPIPFNPIINIVLRSVLVAVLYIAVVFFIKASPTFNALLVKTVLKFKK